MKKLKMLLEAVIVITVVTALIMPGSAVVTNESETTQNKIIDTLKEYRKVLPIEGSSRGDDILIPSGEGDNRIPSITMDNAGHTVVTWTNEEDITTWNMGIAYSDDPTDPLSWTSWIIALDSTEMVFHSDTAYVNGPGTDDFDGLYGVNMYWDTEQVGGYEILDITQDPGDTEYWTYYYWDEVAEDQICRTVEDCSFYEEPYFGHSGPVSMAIYYKQEGFDIPGCPMYFNQDMGEDGSTTFFFDAQANLQTAPARDCDLATSLPDWFHLTWEYYNATEDVNKIVWKKIDPAVEADIEFVPMDWQEYRGEGTNPSIEAYDDGGTIHLAIVYVNDGEVKCVYSNDDGEEWSGPVTVADGVYPALRAIGTTLYCAYIDDNNLFVKTSEDGGATWSEASERINSEEGSVEEEENAVDIHLGGIVWVDDRDGELMIHYAPLDIGNNAPEAPDISGPPNGDSGKLITFTFNAEDPDGDDVRFLINWGDGNSDTTTYVGSGEDQTASHTWKGDDEVFTLSVRAEDSEGLAGPASTFEITIPRNRARFYDLFDIFPNLFRLLNLIFG